MRTRLAVALVGISLFLAACGEEDPVGTNLAEARTDVARSFPIYANGGKPDLTIDPKRFVDQMDIVDRYFQPTDCSIDEGSVGGTGYRRLLRFDTIVMNSGDGDLLIGSPTDGNNPYKSQFFFAQCHQHYHFLGFADYRLLNLDGSIAALGHKQAFCLEDSFKYSGDKSAGYDCAYQGITSGFGDWYYKQLPGQWIDITGVPEGDYIIETTINASGTFDEGQNRYPNTLRVPVHIPDPRNKVAIAN